MTERYDVNNRDKGTPRVEQGYAERLADDRTRMIACAKGWVGNVDWLVREGKLGQARSTLIAECETLVKLKCEEHYWLVKRCLDVLAENGMAVEPRFHKWTARLDNAPAVMGEPIREDLDFGQPERWEEQL